MADLPQRDNFLSLGDKFMYFTSQTYFNSVLDFLAAENIAADQALSAINFSQFTQYKNQQRIELIHYSALLDYGKDALSNPLFGFDVGCDIKNTDYGVLGYLVESSENLAQAIKNLLTFDKLVANIGTIDYHTDNAHTTISWTPVSPCSEQVVLRNMASWLTTARQLLGNDLAPISLALCYPYSQEDQQRLAAHCGCPITANASSNHIVFSSELLSLSFRGDNPQLNQTMAALSAQELANLQQPTLSQQLTHLLAIKPDLHDCSLIQFSHVFSMSPRTLQRQLKREETRFGALLDAERKQRAQRLIHTIKLGELATQLGFNEQSSFNRAFKRWFNCSPSAYQAK